MNCDSAQIPSFHNSSVYIGIGGDCAIAYQLRKLNLSNEAYPFDWVRINKIDMIVDTLQNNFSNFFEYELKKGSEQFFNFEYNLTSRIHLKLKNGIILPHESKQFEFDRIEYEEKYKRRIERFNKVVSDKNIRKIFVRADDNILSEEKKSQLKTELESYGCENFDIRYITYNEFKTDNFTWQRDYVPWTDLLFQ
jgi:hypothetical protein